MKVYVVEGQPRSLRSGYNSHNWKPVDADVLSSYAHTRRKRWAEDHPKQEFRVRSYVPEVFRAAAQTKAESGAKDA